MKPIIRSKLVVALAFVPVAAALVVVLRTWPSSELTPSQVLAESQAAEERVLAQLGEGKALYIRDEVYRRYGPAASLIKSMSTEWYLPERYVQALWLEVGAGGKIVGVRGFVESDGGEPLQTIKTVRTDVITHDVASGAEFRAALGLSVEDMATRMRMSTGFTEEKLAQGTLVVSGEGRLRGRATVILEEAVASPSSITDVDGGEVEGYSIPFVEDIKPVAWLRRTEVAKDSFLAIRWSVVVVDASGHETVVEEKQRIVFEVVEESLGPERNVP